MSITGATYPLFLKTETGDITFQMSELSDIDIEELDFWVRAKYLQTARESFTAATTEAERRETIEIALRVAATMQAFTGLGREIAATIPGLSRMLYVSVKKMHPEIAEKDFRRWLLNPENLSRFNEAFRVLNMPATTGKKGGPHPGQAAG